MSDCEMLSIICAAEAVSELDGSTSYISKTTKKYWIHILNQQRDVEDLFGNFYGLI